NNLVDWRIVDKFENLKLLKTDVKTLEEIFFNLYHNLEEPSFIFEKLVRSLGTNYALIGYFFFIKDKSRYLPVSTTRLDKAFKLIGIEDFKTTRRCSWDNYYQFNLIVNEVADLLTAKIQSNVELLEAHSFLWMISSKHQQKIKPLLK